ncbi:hypothetical protein BDZ94DRAFT_1330866, partial [Collybia nuda]
MTLYEWASRCERIKLSSSRCIDSDAPDEIFEEEPDLPRKKTQGSVILRFEESHPLADTHATICSPTSSLKIPNFIGPTLPRRDQGDREYYCATMLTLFKPWKTGFDLRHSGLSWDESFQKFEFSKRSLKIMSNLNIRYECLDARDDFHAQMKKGGVTFPNW